MKESTNAFDAARLRFGFGHRPDSGDGGIVDQDLDLGSGVPHKLGQTGRRVPPRQVQPHDQHVNPVFGAQPLRRNLQAFRVSRHQDQVHPRCCRPLRNRGPDTRAGPGDQRGALAESSLRYYEEQGLLPAERLANGYREYDEQAVRQVAFIQDLYQAGLPSEVIRDIIPCTGPKPPRDEGECAALVDRVRQVRDQLAHQERQLAERREMLEHYLSGAAAPTNFATTACATHSSCGPAPDHEVRLPY